MSNYSKKFQARLEQLFSELGYTIRYEKGNFTSGYCLVEDTKMVVINKFFDRQGRVQSLVDILNSIKVPLELVSPESQKFHATVPQTIEETSNV